MAINGKYSSYILQLRTALGIDEVLKMIEEMGKVISFQGVSSTDPATGIVTIDGEVITPKDGYLVIYKSAEYIYTESSGWTKLGDESLYVLKDNINPDGIEAEEGYVVSSILITKDGVVIPSIRQLTMGDIPGLTELNLQVTTNTADITTLNGDASTDGSVAKLVSDALTEAKSYTDSLANGQVATNTEDISTLKGDDQTTGSVAKAIKDAIDELDVTDTGVSGQLVSSVSETNGKISVTRRGLSVDDIPSGVSPSKIDSAIDSGNLTLSDDITSMNLDLTTLTGDDQTLGSVAQLVSTALDSAKDYTDDLANGAVATNTGDIATLNGDDQTTGSVAKAIKDAIDGLDVNETNLSGSTVLSKISESDGKISVTTRELSKSDIGLGNVNNTSDADKPVSTALQAALDLKVDLVEDHNHQNTAVTVGSRGNGVVGPESLANGQDNDALAQFSHAEGNGSVAAGWGSHAEGDHATTTANGMVSHAEGSMTIADANASHAEGGTTTAAGVASHSEGLYNKAAGIASHAEGTSLDRISDLLRQLGLTALADYYDSVKTFAGGDLSHTEGFATKTTGMGSHAEGFRSDDNENNFSFVWQGYNGAVPTPLLMAALISDPGSTDGQDALTIITTALQSTQPYTAAKPGTFCINPALEGNETDSTTGVYIGSKSLKLIIDEKVSSALSSRFGTITANNITYQWNAIGDGSKYLIFNETDGSLTVSNTLPSLS